MSKLYIPAEITELIKQGAIFYVSHSGGKDSQAMYIVLRKLIPEEQLCVVHSNLGSVEWQGVKEHILKYTDIPAVTFVRSGKTFMEMVERRGKWPSAAIRQCTSDLKRDPIMKFIRNDLKARNATIAVNCMGLRAQESTARSKRIPFILNKKESLEGSRVSRQVYDWLPIFHLSTDEVFKEIRDAGQEPFWAYIQNERLSCVFCIMGCKNDLRHGAINNPDLYEEYVEMERKIGHTMFMKGKEPIPLEKHIGITVQEARGQYLLKIGGI